MLIHIPKWYIFEQNGKIQEESEKTKMSGLEILLLVIIVISVILNVIQYVINLLIEDKKQLLVEDFLDCMSKSSYGDK